jgi:tRNA(Ile)-lysidine synthetase-like protein
LSQQSCRFQLFTENHAKNIVAKGQLNETSNRYSIDRAYLKDAAHLIFYEVIREILVTLGIGLRPYTREHFDAIRDMIGTIRAKADFPGQIEIAVHNGKVTIEKNSGIPLQFPKSLQLSLGQAVEFGPWEISSRLLDRADVDLEHFVKTKDDCVEWFDADKINGALEIRCRVEGDRFRPIGGTGEKKVSRFLQDGQFDSEIKRNAFVITNAEKILWLAPVRMSEVFRITKKTRLFLEIRVSIV